MGLISIYIFIIDLISQDKLTGEKIRCILNISFVLNVH